MEYGIRLDSVIKYDPIVCVLHIFLPSLYHTRHLKSVATLLFVQQLHANSNENLHYWLCGENPLAPSHFH